MSTDAEKELLDIARQYERGEVDLAKLKHAAEQYGSVENSRLRAQEKIEALLRAADKALQDAEPFAKPAALGASQIRALGEIRKELRGALETAGLITWETPEPE